jgi:hypothetical protein
LEVAFAAMNKAAVKALFVLTDPILYSQRKRTVDLANKNRLPAMYFFQGFAEEGVMVPAIPTFFAAGRVKIEFDRPKMRFDPLSARFL